MKPRKINRWKCQLIGDNGSTIERTLEAFWDPEKIPTEDVANTCAAMETVRAKHKPRYHGVAAALVEDVAAAA